MQAEEERSDEHSAPMVLTVSGPYIDSRHPREPLTVSLKRGRLIEVHRWRYGDEAAAQDFADYARKGTS